MWQLIINGPGYFDTTYDLPEGLTSLGRADENDIVLSGDLVSRKHARITVAGDDLTIEDLGSRNGSRLNGQPFTGTAELKAGDLVHVGENTLSIRQPNKVENQATEMVDLGAGGVKRYGEGMDIGSMVVVAKNVKESVVLRALDNIMPFTPREGIPLPDLDLGGPGADRPTPLPGSLPAASPSAGTPTPITYDALLLLYKVSEALSTSRTQQAFLELTADRVLESVKATTAVVLLRHHSGVMVPAVVRHRGRLAQGEVPVSDAVISAALSKGAALAVQDVRGDARFNARESVLLYGVDQVLCIPIGEKEPFSGVLYINKPAGPANELESLLDLCGAVSHLIASGVERFRNADKPSAGPERGRAALDRFFPPAIAERRAAELQRAGAQGTGVPKLEDLTLSVLVADLAGFTAMIQKLEPALVADLLNELYTRATAVIFSFEGTLEKFVGDAVVGVFGAPYAQADGPLRAVRAAMALRQDWAKAVAKRPAHARPELKIAVNTGKGLAGLIGPEGRQDYAVVGDVVNVASWLCASALPGQVLITGKTLASIGARFDVTPLGERGLKPGREKVPVFEVMEEDVATMTGPGAR